MASSLGLNLMSWTTALIRQSKEKKKKKATKSQTLKENCQAVQTDETSCPECVNLRKLEFCVRKLEVERAEMNEKLNICKNGLAVSMDREKKLRDDHENLLLEDAQVRHELHLLKSELSSKLSDRDDLHTERFQLLEKEIASLWSVIEMKSLENRDLRSFNNDLLSRLEAQKWIESDLTNAKMRLEEMTTILKSKVASERELLELGESLQKQLVKSQDEILLLKRDLENCQSFFLRGKKIG